MEYKSGMEPLYLDFLPIIQFFTASDYEVIIWQAIQEYYDQTNGCISFVERTDEENYVIITKWAKTLQVCNKF